MITKKIIPSIITKKFEDMDVGDYVVYEEMYFGKHNKYIIKEVVKIDQSVLHKHWYLVFDDGEKVYQHEKEFFIVLKLANKVSC